MLIQQEYGVVVRSGRTPCPRAAARVLRTSRSWPFTRARPPPLILDAPRDDLEAEACTRARGAARSSAGSTSAPRVSTLCMKEMLQPRTRRQQARPARRCATDSGPRTNGRRDAGTGPAGCRCSRYPRRRYGPTPSRRGEGCRAPSVAVRRARCCAVSCQRNRRSRSIGIEAQADGPAGREHQWPRIAVVLPLG